jgi:hypothetical protein
MWAWQKNRQRNQQKRSQNQKSSFRSCNLECREIAVCDSTAHVHDASGGGIFPAKMTCSGRCVFVASAAIYPAALKSTSVPQNITGLSIVRGQAYIVGV